jgi:hypothetical protein
MMAPFGPLSTGARGPGVGDVPTRRSAEIIVEAVRLS